MEKIKPKNSVRGMIITFIFIVIVVFGYYPIIDVRLMGMIPTYYRVIIPIFFICIIVFNQKNKLELKLFAGKHNKLVGIFFIVMIFWIIYGAVSLILSPWSDFSVGAKELLSLVLGALSAYIIISFCLYDQFDNMILAIKVVVAVMLLIGYIEVLTGYHLNTSLLSDPDYLHELEVLYKGQDVPDAIKYIATGIFYNPNDYCAFLSIFTPIFLFGSSKNKKGFIRAADYAAIAGVFLILLIDDAWICIISLVLALAAYLIITRAGVVKWIATAGILVVTRVLGKYIIGGLLAGLYLISKNEIFNHATPFSNIEATLGVQIDNMSQNGGSLLFRINTYLESIAGMFTQSKGLGLGAGSYSKYFAPMAESKAMMSNPHSLWIEILSQYGAIIFLAVVLVLIVLFVKLIGRCIAKKDNRCAVVIAMGVCLVFASFAPSSFLNNTYYWIPIAMGLGILLIENKDGLNDADQ